MRIGILGLRRDQFSKLHQVGAELVYLGQDQRHYRGQLDRVVLCTKFIKHHHQERLVKAYGKHRIIYANGSTSSLQEQLCALTRSTYSTATSRPTRSAMLGSA